MAENANATNNICKNENQPPVLLFLTHWVFFVILSIFLVWLLRVLHDPTFQVNDNLIVIENAKSGFLTPYFVHFTWSWLLTGLYAVAPQVPWYGLLLYALQVVSISLIMTVFFRAIPGILYFIIFIIIVLFFWSDMIVRLDFTGTSILYGSAIVLLFLLAHREGRLSRRNAVFLGIILSVSMLPRLEGIQAVSAVAAPFLAAFWIVNARQSPRPAKALSNMACLFTCLFLPSILFFGANSVYRSNFLPQDEAAYARFFRLLVPFPDYPISQENRQNPEVYKATGWTPGDYLRLEHWMYFDENIYNVESFEKFYEHAWRPERKAMELRRVISSLFVILKRAGPFLLVMAAGLALAWGRRIYALRDFILYCLAAAAILLIALALEIFLRFPYRIGYPMLFSAGLFVFFISTVPKTKKKVVPDEISAGKEQGRNLQVKIVLTAMVFLAGLAHGNHLKIQYKGIQAHRQFDQAMTRHINTHFPGVYLITEPRLSPFHYIDPLDPPDRKFNILPVGWPTFSPLFYQRLQQMGLKQGTELLPAMIYRKDILVLSQEVWMQLLVNYAKQRGFEVNDVESLARLGKVHLYRLKLP